MLLHRSAETNLIQVRFLLLLLMMFCYSSCQSPTESAPQGGDLEFQTAVSRAKERIDDGSYALAELDARKAVRLKSDDIEAKYLLFLSLKEQSAPELQAEAQTLGTSLKDQFKADSEKATVLQSYLEKTAAAEIISKLKEAVEKKDPEAESLFDQIPESARDESYWRLAFSHYKNGDNHKKKAEAAENWLQSKPSGLSAKEAETYLQLYKDGLFQGPEAPFEAYRKAKPPERSRFLIGRQPQFSKLDTMLKKAEVKKTSVKGDTLTATLAYKDPYTKMPTTSAISLRYVKQKDAFYLEPRQSNLPRILSNNT